MTIWSSAGASSRTSPVSTYYIIWLCKETLAPKSRAIDSSWLIICLSYEALIASLSWILSGRISLQCSLQRTSRSKSLRSWRASGLSTPIRPRGWQIPLKLVNRNSKRYQSLSNPQYKLPSHLDWILKKEKVASDLHTYPLMMMWAKTGLKRCWQRQLWRRDTRWPLRIS